MEWQALAPLFATTVKTSRHPSLDMCEVINATVFILRGGVPWRMLPKYVPLRQTTYRRFMRFRNDGTSQSLNQHLVILDCERAGREVSPTAAVIDAQSVKITEASAPRFMRLTGRLTRSN